MRRFFVIMNLLFLSFCCFSQQKLPSSIIGGIPNTDSTKTFQIQVGAFRIAKNADNAALKLKTGGFVPVKEKYLDLSRVMISGIPGGQVSAYLGLLKLLGFDEVIVREEGERTIAEKWNITTPESAFASFEFNQDKNYIAIESRAAQAGEAEPLVHFGEYSMPSDDTINMNGLGTLRIINDDKSGVDLFFSPSDDPENVQPFTATKADSVPQTPESDLFCRTWKVIKDTNNEFIGNTILFSNAGTYLVTKNDGYSFVSRWRWYGENRGEFEYSHDDWQHYGRAKILELKQNSLVFNDAGYNTQIEGYSSADLNDINELEPVNR